MSIFRDFFVKEKPVFTGITRGLGGFGFGSGSGGGEEEGFSASGGSKFSLSGYTYHVFLSSGSFVVAEGSKDVELVAIGGGGSGGYFYGSGGGAGGCCHATAFPMTPGTYTCTVGDGASAPGNSQSVGSKGSHSEIYKGSPGPSSSNVYATGGGGGGYNGAPTPSDPWGPGGCPGGVNHPLAGLNSSFPSSTQHPSVTKYSGDGGKGSPSNVDAGGGGGGIGGGGSGTQGGPGRAFAMLPGPEIYPLLPSPDQSTVGTVWRDTLGPTGLIGGGGNGYNLDVAPGGPSIPTRPGGGGSGTATYFNGVNYTGSGGRGPSNPGVPGTGGKGLIVIRYQ